MSTPTEQSPKNSPKISIVMLVYNTELYIKKAIDSVLAQTETDWELVLVDDESTDRSEEIILSYNDPRIRYHRLAHTGKVSANRNTGMRLGRGKYLACLDADDMFYPDTLAKLAGYLDTHQDCLTVYGFPKHINVRDEEIGQDRFLIPKNDGTYDLPIGYAHTWEKILFADISVYLSGMIFRREVLDQVGGINEDNYAADDYEFFCRMFLKNPQSIHCIPEYVYQYRIHGSSITNDTTKCLKVMDSCCQTLDWLYEQSPVKGRYDHIKSKTYLARYQWGMRSQLMQGNMTMVRTLAQAAYHNPNVNKLDWFKLVLPIYIRTMLPTVLDQRLIELKRTFKRLTYKAPQQQHGHPAHA